MAGQHHLCFGLHPQRCAVCSTTSGLLRCGGCKVVSYRGAPHQHEHHAYHKATCQEIVQTRETFAREDAALRAYPGDWTLPADALNTCVGDFWGLLGTRDYMRARYAAANALLKLTPWPNRHDRSFTLIQDDAIQPSQVYGHTSLDVRCSGKAGMSARTNSKLTSRNCLIRAH
ncbi:hypothetical protein QBC35DRAFT_500331 [Podospora australis]|uniref:MYND-type domain-containing protein n=1 Tax=Podospora australis TaxID=1536484 RepID=A0AAN6WV38_9PEZI|nr:hypothetical protein QBC35DRAFT_500331 [Podospora australis]